VVKWIKTGYAKSRTRLPRSILTPKEIKILINAATCVQHKAMLAVLFDTGCRLSELIGMKIEQIQYDENGGYIVINGKTGERIARFIFSMSYLSAWLEHHPLKDCKGSNPLWICRTNWANNSPLTKSGAYQVIREIAEKTNINKKISPHQFRHARITDLARKGLNESTLKVLAGWQGDSSMPEVYIHLSGRDGANQLLEVERQGAVKPTIVENPLKPAKCPRCKFENGATNSYCGRCGIPTTKCFGKLNAQNSNAVLPTPNITYPGNNSISFLK